MKIAEAEQRAIARAAEAAYKATEMITDPDIQKVTYELMKEGMELGILIMEEELINVTE